jgi:hypothetical protein
MADLTDGAASSGTSPNRAFDLLFAGLREAKCRFENGDHAGRDGVIHALESVLKFLGHFEQVENAALHAPLGALFDALLHLDDGETHPMLQKVTLSGRARASAGRESLMGIIAFTVDRLCTWVYPSPTHTSPLRACSKPTECPPRAEKV